MPPIIKPMGSIHLNSLWATSQSCVSRQVIKVLPNGINPALHWSIQVDPDSNFLDSQTNLELGGSGLGKQSENYRFKEIQLS